MKDSKYVTDFVKTVYTESTELCMTAFDEKECLQDATILINQLRAENKQLIDEARKIVDLLDAFEINICSDDDTQNWWRVNFKDGCIEKDCSNIEQEYIPEKKDNVVG